MGLQRGSRDEFEGIFPAFTSERSGKPLNHEEMGWGCGEQYYQHNEWLIFIKEVLRRWQEKIVKAPHANDSIIV